MRKTVLQKQLTADYTLIKSHGFMIFIKTSLRWFFRELKLFIRFLRLYLADKSHLFSHTFERNKNVVVRNVLIKRGKRNRIFLHVSALGVLTAGIIISPFIQDSNPFSSSKNASIYAQNATVDSLAPDDVFTTQTSDKPRDKTLTYTVQKGDTLSIISKKFGISEDTIKWANDLKGTELTVGDELKILPVTGIAHKVESGDTVYSIAKKYSANAQSIVDFPFNDFANPQTFSLVTGEVLMVPDGVKPADQPKYVRQTYVAVGSSTVSGGWAWPIRGTMNQYFSWYHTAIDVGDPIGTPVLAAQNGVVRTAASGGWNGGYGIHVVIQGDNGYGSLYAHMMSLNVGAGSRVQAGKTVLGWVGMTGRTTGPHLHFEIQSAGGNQNPLAFLNN